MFLNAAESGESEDAMMTIDQIESLLGQPYMTKADAAEAIETLREIAWLLDDYADRLDEAKGYMDPSDFGDEERAAAEERITNVARILGHHPQPDAEGRGKIAARKSFIGVLIEQLEASAKGDMDLAAQVREWQKTETILEDEE